ncbi:MAG: sigma-54 interaction domain-containing protein [Myxococcaceae bacterium]
MSASPGTVDPIRRAGWAAVSAAFGSLGRICLSLDASFNVIHVSTYVDALLGEGASVRLVGRSAEWLLGPELFGPEAELRQALASGNSREGWRASIRLEPSGSRLVSVSAAPLRHDPDGVCDLDARYLVVIRPAEEEEQADGAPTGFGGMVVRSPAMARILRLIVNLEQSEATVLLTGESGTGKEVAARAVHAHSPRRDGPFVAVNCGALPADLLEAELFGHVRGAFTGAVRDRVGRFEAAGRGTLFLDEVGDLPLALQVKLLRVLQERTFERVGESEPRPTDARIIAATNVELRRAVRAGTFRDDLFYRLRVVPIELPPLRARREDVEPLARALLARVGGRQGRAQRFSPEALRALLRYPWPGNVRELENAIEFATAVSRGQTILPDDLPPEVLAGPQATLAPEGALPPTPSADAPPSAGLPDGSAQDEGAQLRAALHAPRWSRADTARALGISRSTLWRKMREHRLAR